MAKSAVFAVIVLVQIFVRCHATDKETEQIEIIDLINEKLLIGKFQYQLQTMSIWENRHGNQSIESDGKSPRHFYVSPLVRLLTNATECQRVVLSNSYRINFELMFWNRELAGKAVIRLKDLGIEANENQISQLPFYQVRVVWKNSNEQPSKTIKLNSAWSENLSQPWHQRFYLIATDRRACKNFVDEILTNPDALADSISLEYSSNKPESFDRLIDIKKEHVSNTDFFTKMKSMIITDDNGDNDKKSTNRYLTAESINLLANQIVDRAIKLSPEIVVSTDYLNPADQSALQEIVSEKIQRKKILPIKEIDSIKWKRVFWNPSMARPDKLCKFLNTVYMIDSKFGKICRLRNSKEIREKNRVIDASERFADEMKGLGVVEDLKIDYRFSDFGNSKSINDTSVCFGIDVAKSIIQETGSKIEIVRKKRFLPEKSIDLFDLDLNELLIEFQQNPIQKRVKINRIGNVSRLRISAASDVEEIAEENRYLRDRLISIDNRLSALDRKLSETDIKTNQLQNKISESIGNIDRLQSSSNTLSQKIANAENSLDQIKSALRSTKFLTSSTCDICYQEAATPSAGTFYTSYCDSGGISNSWSDWTIRNYKYRYSIDCTSNSRSIL